MATSRLMPLRPYRNLSGRSGVVAFESGADFLRVEFVDGGVYLYTWSSTGASKVESMKKLAERGEGLATFINRFVRDSYERREA